MILIGPGAGFLVAFAAGARQAKCRNEPKMMYCRAGLMSSIMEIASNMEASKNHCRPGASQVMAPHRLVSIASKCIITRQGYMPAWTDTDALAPRRQCHSPVQVCPGLALSSPFTRALINLLCCRHCCTDCLLFCLLLPLYNLSLRLIASTFGGCLAL